MLRLFSLLLSLLLLLQSVHVSLADLAGLDELMEHARYHQQEFGDNFLTFLSKHYGDQKADHAQKHQEEKSQHEQLPFQQLAHLTGVNAFMLRQPALELALPLDPSDDAQPNFYYFRPGYSGFQSGIFQPPRQA